LGNHRFVNILAFESAIQVLNGLAANAHNPASAAKKSVYDVSHTKLAEVGNRYLINSDATAIC